ncbi:hypothetical protein IMSAGC020_02549 [Lachnospiraceae bacterium]|jgi:hypothetical protein|nr:hypothetical protein IMSAGC020_02549 [Lachnospiraceae bacterium]
MSGLQAGGYAKAKQVSVVRTALSVYLEDGE